MNEPSAAISPRRRRRYSPEFKARIIAACQQPEASAAQVAKAHDLNANMVRRWIKAAQTRPAKTVPAFVPVARPTPPAEAGSPISQGDMIRLEVSRAGGALTITWPVAQADNAMALLRELLL